MEDCCDCAVASVVQQPQLPILLLQCMKRAKIPHGMNIAVFTLPACVMEKLKITIYVSSTYKK